MKHNLNRPPRFLLYGFLLMSMSVIFTVTASYHPGYAVNGASGISKVAGATPAGYSPAGSPAAGNSTAENSPANSPAAGNSTAGYTTSPQRNDENPVRDALTSEDIPRSEIDDLFSEYDRSDVPGCAVGIYQGDQTLYTGSFGMANLDHGISLSDSSAFFMGSLSKQVTAAAAGLLVVREELDTGEYVSEYLEDWPDWAGEVQVRHLFNHTSGLPDHYELMDIAGISLSNVMELDDYISVIINGEPLKHRPGSRFSFTNSGYTVLAKLVEKLSNTDFSVFVDEELLEPIGMDDTHFHDDRYRIIRNRAISYAPADTGEDEVTEEDGSNPDTPSEETVFAFRQTYLGNFQGVGPQGLYSSLKDWQHWEAFLNGEKDLPDEFRELREFMKERAVVDGDTLDYGMGMEIETWQGLHMEGHSGDFMGFKTDIRRFPEFGLGLLTLCNREDADPPGKNRSMARLLLGEYFEAFLESYEGIYHNEELQVEYELTAEDGALKLNRKLSPNGNMTEQEHDKWEAGSWDFVFQRDEEGAVIGFLVSTGRAREVEFIKQ